MKRKPSFSKRCLGTMLPAVLFLLATTGAWAQDVAALSPSLVNKTNLAAESDLKTTSLQEFMNEFKKVYQNIYYSYESNTLRSVKVNYDALDVASQSNPDIALNKVLATAGLMFEKVKDVYVIKEATQKKPEENFAIPAAMISATADAADFSVRGRITDENGGVSGATVTEKGTGNVTTTNSNGEFAITVSGTNAVLVISHVSYATKEVAVSGKAVLDITLDASSKELEQVVVTSLGMKREKRALGYSISSVNAEDMETGGTSNVLKSVEGKVTGVQMNSVTSSPTSSVMFNIRGATSLKGIMSPDPARNNRNINNETQPLIVLNGVQLGSNTVGATSGIDAGNFISTLNPNDIESISVLKGASAAALYGSAAGNGVILITTKSGAGAKKGLGISVSSATSFDQAYSAPPVQRSFFQGDEDGSALTEDKKGLGWHIDDKVNNNTPEWRWNLLTQEWEKSVLEARGDKNPLLAFLRTGVMTDNNVAVTGNYDKGNYRINLGNLVHNAVIPGNKTSRNSISFDGKYNINDRISVTSQASWSHTFVPNQSHVQDKREDNPLAHAMSMPINMPKMSEWENADPWITDWEGQYQNSPYLKGPGQDRLRYNAVGKNGPYFAAENIIRTYSKDVFFGKVQLDYKIGEPFLLTLRSGISHENFAFERKSPWDAERRPQGIYEQQHSNNLNVRNDLLLSYNKRFLDSRLSLDALGGFSYNYGEGNNSGFGGEILATPNSFTYSSLPAAVRQAAYFNRDYPSRSYGAYATASIGWQNMVYLELSGRNDWVGILPHEKDHHFYPGASLSWIASETFDMGNVFNFLKLRGGYAETGYGIGQPVNLDSYGISGNTWNGIAMGTIGGSLVDAKILPELNVTKEAGIDFRALDSRISGEFTIYSKNHINQIQNLPVVNSSGFANVLTNMGSVKSTGIEAALTVTPVRTKDWQVNLTGNITTFKSVIHELDSRFSEKFYSYDGAAMLSLFKGSRVGDLYAENPIGYVQTGKYAGMMLTGIDGIIEEAVTTTDYIRKNGYLGNMNPKAIYGFVADARYKNFRLNIVASYRSGGIFISETQKIMIDDGMADIMALYGDKYNEYWTGGRFAGGLPSMPNPDDMFTEPGFENYREKMQELMTMYNGDPRYFGYWNAVYINPNVDQSQMTPEEKLRLSDGDYIKNGDDPTKTLFLNPYNMEGQELWSGAQFRTHDATSLKLKEINLTYTFNRPLAQKLRCQDISITAFAKNVMFWAKNKMNEDPETAFYDGVRGMGVADFGLPPIRTMGVRLNVSF